MASSTSSYLQFLIPELLLPLGASLPTASLSVLSRTCRRLHTILKPSLDGRIRGEAYRILSWAASKGKTEVVRKLLDEYKDLNFAEERSWLYGDPTPLHCAAQNGHVDIVSLLLDDGASVKASCDQPEYQPLHMAIIWGPHPEVVRLLLERGAPLDEYCGCDGVHATALHLALERRNEKNEEIIKILLEHGASMERYGDSGPALYKALWSVSRVKLLLERGANAEKSIDLYGSMLEGYVTQPRNANLLYSAMGLRHPRALGRRKRRRRGGAEEEKRVLPRWQEDEESKAHSREVMGLLLAYGASKQATLDLISAHLPAFAEAAAYTEEEFMDTVQRMMKEAEERVPVKPETTKA